jgi:prolipoprotein diacylglyceryltransferase
MDYLHTSFGGIEMRYAALICLGIVLGWWAHHHQIRYENNKRQREFDEAFARLRHATGKARKDGSK